MTESRDESAELDPTLEAWLAEARAEDDGATPDLAPLLGAVESRIAAAEGSPAFWLKSRSSATRRVIAGGAAALIVGLGGALALRGDFASYPPIPMAIALGSLATLLGLAIHQSLRPLHRPPMSRGARATMVALTLGATFAIALFAPSEAADDVATHGLLEHVSPCLFYGLLVGLPLYLVLRLLDRGGARTALLAACAAGLIGNLALTLHCPIDDPEHLMLAHAQVAVLFLAGLGVVHLVLRALWR